MDTQGREQVLTKQIATVIGGGRGIGQATSLALADAGAIVAVVARSENGLSETIAHIQAMGGKAYSFAVDVLDQRAVEHMVKEVEHQLGPIDILVNSAGRHRALGPLWKVDAEEWRMDVESNLFGTFYCMHAVLPGMVAGKRGRIINISSAAGNMPRPHSTAYNCIESCRNTPYRECCTFHKRTWSIYFCYTSRFGSYCYGGLPHKFRGWTNMGT